MEAIEKDHGQLTVLYVELRRAQQAANVMENNNASFVDVDGLNIWDDVELDIIPNSDDMPLDSDAASGTAPAPALARNALGPSAIEDYLIPLPSNGNVDVGHKNLEIAFRSSRAEHHLARIRELIAEKSFQYSHVMRVSPRKGTTTRSRASIKKLNTEIALHCRMYARCRARLILLGGDKSRFKVLTPDDVKASTAIINPNVSGSTQLKLSWIWESSDGHRFGARAQLMRWQEEVTLITYEMQWAVRFFVRKSHIWANAGEISGLPVKAGSAAYALRQIDMWKQIAVRANRTFTYINTAYKCPLLLI